jgi:DNA-binding SARP family transcriptional activator/pimeloyl-ACP methyl ester carboxylesterase
MGKASIQLLGPLKITDAASNPLVIRGRKQQALLVYLALNVDLPPSRDKLATIFWGDRFDSQARQSLRQAISRLRKILAIGGKSVLLTDGDHVGLNPEAVDIDACEFERQVADGSPEALAKAASLYKHMLADGLHVNEAAFEEWIRFERARFQETACGVLARLAAHQADVNETQEAIETGHRLIALDPLNEAGHRLLMRAYAASEQLALAQKQYKACAALLLGEFGSQPETETQRLFEEICARKALPISQTSGVRQEIHFCTAIDDVRIAYAISGKGPPIVKTANWLNHLEHDWQNPVWGHLVRELSREHTVLRYDQRGNGLSDWDVADLSFNSWVDDLEVVVNAAGLDQFALYGISQGCAVSIAYAVRHPDRVTRLVLQSGYAKGSRIDTPPSVIAKHEAMLTLIREGWAQDNPAFRQMFASMLIPDATTEQVNWMNELQRISTSPEIAVRLFDEFSKIDVRELLPQVRTPTLVIHSRNDARIPFETGREIAAGIPNARFVPVDSRNHLILEQEKAWLNVLSEIDEFLL